MGGKQWTWFISALIRHDTKEQIWKMFYQHGSIFLKSLKGNHFSQYQINISCRPLPCVCANTHHKHSSCWPLWWLFPVDTHTEYSDHHTGLAGQSSLRGRDKENRYRRAPRFRKRRDWRCWSFVSLPPPGRTLNPFADLVILSEAKKQQLEGHSSVLKWMPHLMSRLVLVWPLRPKEMTLHKKKIAGEVLFYS